MSTDTITGYEAIEYAEAHGLTLNIHTTPIQEAREGVTVEEAREVAKEDPGLIWIEGTPIATQVDRAATLTDLCRVLRAAGQVDDRVMTDLPTYGGEEPADALRTGVWSWDETSLLVGTCASDLRVVPRE